MEQAGFNCCLIKSVVSELIVDAASRSMQLAYILWECFHNACKAWKPSSERIQGNGFVGECCLGLTRAWYGCLAKSEIHLMKFHSDTCLLASKNVTWFDRIKVLLTLSMRGRSGFLADCQAAARATEDFRFGSLKSTGSPAFPMPAFRVYSTADDPARITPASIMITPLSRCMIFKIIHHRKVSLIAGSVISLVKTYKIYSF